jgi:hypothetical protein
VTALGSIERTALLRILACEAGARVTVDVELGTGLRVCAEGTLTPAEARQLAAALLEGLQ